MIVERILGDDEYEYIDGNDDIQAGNFYRDCFFPQPVALAGLTGQGTHVSRNFFPGGGGVGLPITPL